MKTKNKKDIYIVNRNSKKVYQTRDQRLQEVALGIDNWDELSDEDQEYMLNSCGIIGWGYREHWWEFWKPKIKGFFYENQE